MIALTNASLVEPRCLENFTPTLYTFIKYLHIIMPEFIPLPEIIPNEINLYYFQLKENLSKKYYSNFGKMYELFTKPKGENTWNPGPSFTATQVNLTAEQINYTAPAIVEVQIDDEQIEADINGQGSSVKVEYSTQNIIINAAISKGKSSIMKQKTSDQVAQETGAGQDVYANKCALNTNRVAKRNIVEENRKKSKIVKTMVQVEEGTNEVELYEHDPYDVEIHDKEASETNIDNESHTSEYTEDDSMLQYAQDPIVLESSKPFVTPGCASDEDIDLELILARIINDYNFAGYSLELVLKLYI